MSSNKNSIAIIGMSGIFPQAKDIFEYWDNLKKGRDCITEIPSSRLAELSSPLAKWGGFIEGIKQFDMDFFNIAPVEARFMTPNERLFLQESWKCIESAGYRPDTLVDKLQGRVGVFVGVTFNDYGLYSNSKTPANSQTFSVANRVSYFCDFKGPSFTVDTACSSSLYAIHLAIQSLNNGECQVALTGGINLTLHPSKFEALDHFGFLASDGRCHSFGEGGNGYVPSEGVGAILLKPLQQAIKDKDMILGVIRGSGVSQSGKGNGYHVPNPIAQTQAIDIALEQAQIDPRTISYLEAHGTGTALGDPIEITGLQDAFEPKTRDKQFCAIGSVKSLIGHLEGAAGISQMIKVVLQIQAKQIAPTLTHSEQLNQKIKFEQTPFYVARELIPWTPHDLCPRRAGISSIGAGGVNVHLLVDEYQAPEQVVKNDVSTNLIPLSAKTISSLEAAVKNLHQFLKARITNQDELFSIIQINDLAYTLQTGRVSMRYRLMLEVKDLEDLIQQLNALEQDPAYLKQQIQDKQRDLPDRASIAQALQTRDFKTLASAWLKGANIKWEELYKDHPQQRIYLPTYTFSTEYCWPYEQPQTQHTDAVDIKSEPTVPALERKPTSSLLQSLYDVPENEKIAIITKYLQRIVAKTLEYPESKLPEIDAGFFDLGISSVQTVALMNQIQSDLQVQVSQTAAFDYPSIKAYTHYLLSIIPKEEQEPLQQAKTTPIAIQQDKLYEDNDIAVIAMACRFPGNSNTPEQFWELIQNGKDGIVDMPIDRWDVSQYYDADPDAPGKMYVRKGGFISQKIDLFDAKLFGISATEAIDMDPQQRLLLELAWEVFENSNYNNQQLTESKTGVFIGMAVPEYLLIPGDKKHYDLTCYSPYWATGSISSMASGRIAHTFGLHGPAITVDTACSSSLVSTHLACESIRKGECEQALAGGINLLLSPAAFIGLCRVRALAADGYCKTFDSTGDGYGRSEGAGLVLLKSLSAAQRDGDQILAVIKGSAINQDGPSSGLTVPNGNAQKVLIMEALKNAKLSASDISYLEAHGTGTSLGDPIEMHSVTEALGQDRSPDNPLYLGAVKRNIGHTEAAAGIAGFIKSVLCLHHKKIPPLPINQLNPKIDLNKIPAKIPDNLIDWETKVNRRYCGISSFGFSGTNAHMILAEAPEPLPLNQNVVDRSLHILTVSAQTQTALQMRLDDFKSFLQRTEASVADLAYSANTGHQHFPYRIAVIADSREMLLEQLSSTTINPPLSITRQVLLIFSEFEGNAQEYEKAFYVFPTYKKTMDDLTSLIDTTNNKLLQFCIEYALYQLWLSLGIPIDGVYGESVGAYVAAVAAGIMEVETALALLSGSKQPEQITLNAPKITFVSSQTGEAVKSSEVTSPEYWKQQASIPANTIKAITSMQARGYNEYIQINPGSALFTSEHYYRPHNEKTMIESLAQLYLHGLTINWTGFDRDYQRNKVVLPNYPFQRKSYWIEMVDTHVFGTSTENDNKIPLQGLSLPVFANEYYFSFRISRHHLPELKDTHGVIHVGHFQEMIVNALKTMETYDHYTITDMNFLLPLMIDEEEIRDITLILAKQDDGTYQFKCLSQQQGADKWSLHNQGMIHLKKAMPSHYSMTIHEQQPIYTKELFYSMMNSRGLNLGPSVQLIDSVWRTGNIITAKLHLPDQESCHNMPIHPGIFDACAQLFHVALPQSAPADLKMMVVKWGEFSFKPEIPFTSLSCDLLIKPEEASNSKDSYSGDFILYNESGLIIAQGLHCKMQGFTDTTLQALRAAIGHQTKTAEQNPFLTELLNTPEELRIKKISNLVKTLLAQLLTLTPEEIPQQESLIHFGIDSITAVSFRNEINKKLGMDLGVEALMTGPSVEELTTRINTLLSQNLSYKQPEPLKIIDRAIWYAGTRKPDAKYRLFCFPYGGGGAFIYREWQARLSPEIDIIPIQLPGRENRIKETPYTELKPLINDIIEVIKPDLDKPFGIFGHSFGGFLTYNLTNALIHDHQITPKNIFISAYSAPSIENPRLMKIINRLKEAHKEMLLESNQLSDEDIASIIDLKLFPECDTMSNLFIPLYIRVGFADVKVIKSFHYEPCALECDLTVFHGSHDVVVLEQEMREWVFLTKKDFKLYTIEGEHLFINEPKARDEILAIVEKTLLT